MFNDDRTIVGVVPEQIVFVALMEDMVVGAVGVSSVDTTEILIVVHPDYRRLAISLDLLERASEIPEAWAGPVNSIAVDMLRKAEWYEFIENDTFLAPEMED